MDFPASLQGLIETAVSDRAKAIRGVADIAKANADLDTARQRVAVATQAETDATAAASQSEPQAVAAFTQWLRDQADAVAQPPVDPAPAAEDKVFPPPTIALE